MDASTRTVVQHLKRDRAIAGEKLRDPKIRLATGSRRYWERKQREYTIVYAFLQKHRLV